MVCVQIQVILVGLPVIAILQDVSTDGRYIGQTLLVWTIPMTTMSLIILPKMFLVRRAKRGGDADRTSSKRGTSQGTRISGLSEPPPASTRSSGVTGGSKGPVVQTVIYE